MCQAIAIYPNADLKAIDVKNGGRYEVALRTPGQSGKEVLHQAAKQAAEKGTRLFGFFGEAKSAHLPVPHRRRRLQSRPAARNILWKPTRPPTSRRTPPWPT